MPEAVPIQCEHCNLLEDIRAYFTVRMAWVLFCQLMMVESDIDLSGQHVVIIGRSLLVGKTLVEVALRRKTGLTLISVVHADGRVEENPGAKFRISTERKK